MSSENLSPESTSDSADSAGSSKSPKRKPRKRRRILKFALFFAVIVAAAVAAAPEIIARTSLRNSLMAKFAPEYDGRVVLGQASLGWFRPIFIQQLTLQHREGETWATIDDLKSEFTLLDLILEPSQLGQWSASQCDVTIQCEPGLTDVERWLSEVLSGQEESQPSNVSFQTETLLLTLKTPEQESRFRITNLDYRQTSTHEVGVAGKVDVLADIAEETAGSLDVVFDVTEQSEVELTASAFPLGSLGPLFVRLGVLEPVSGTFDGAWKVVGDQETMFVLDGRGTARKLIIGQPDDPHFSVESMNLDLAATQTEAGWTVSRLQGQTDFGKLALEGAISLPASWKQDATLETLLEQTFAVTGDVSLSALVDHFPGLIALQQEVELQQGTSSFRLES